ncbi:MAG: hypothetical protein AAB320_09980 [Elusimicrobiota bacterium]
MLVGLIFGLTGAGPEPRKARRSTVGGNFDKATGDAMVKADKLQKIDDKTLARKELEEKQKNRAKLDSFVQDRAAKNPEDLGIQRGAVAGWTFAHWEFFFLPSSLR